jgi:hypothetical protein
MFVRAAIDPVMQTPAANLSLLQMLRLFLVAILQMLVHHGYRLRIAGMALIITRLPGRNLRFNLK